MGSHLFRSNGGVKLIPEVCLQIAEEVINSDPKSAGSLLRLSKAGVSGCTKHPEDLLTEAGLQLSPLKLRTIDFQEPTRRQQRWVYLFKRRSGRDFIFTYAIGGYRCLHSFIPVGRRDALSAPYD